MTGFIERRTKGEAEQPLSVIYPGSGYAAHETAKKDKFFNAYIGKPYPDGATEAFSMGMESTLGYRQKQLRSMDAEHERLILGVLATG